MRYSVCEWIIHHTRRPKGAIRFIELLSLPHLINGHFFVTPYLIGCLIKFTYFPLQLSRNRCICRCWFASASCWSIFRPEAGIFSLFSHKCSRIFGQIFAVSLCRNAGRNEFVLVLCLLLHLRYNLLKFSFRSIAGSLIFVVITMSRWIIICVRLLLTDFNC